MNHTNTTWGHVRTKQIKSSPGFFLNVHLCSFVCDGLGFRMYDGHFFCSYLSFLGCKRVWYSHHFCLYHRWLGREEREKWGRRTEGYYIKPETVRGNIKRRVATCALALNIHFQLNNGVFFVCHNVTVNVCLIPIKWTVITWDCILLRGKWLSCCTHSCTRTNAIMQQKPCRENKSLLTHASQHQETHNMTTTTFSSVQGTATKIPLVSTCNSKHA